MYFDPAEGMRPPPLKRNPFKALVVPRPIGWITTMSAGGVINLAPFSYFNAVSDSPPCVIYCPNGSHGEGGAKDSLKNVEETGEFVCNLVTWDTREFMNLTSEHLPRSVDEMAKVGLEAAPSVKVRPPRVSASPAHLECVHHQTIELPEGKRGIRNFIVVGIHIRDDVIVDGIVDIGKLRPVARLGYMDYTMVDDFFTMMRPD